MRTASKKTGLVPPEAVPADPLDVLGLGERAAPGRRIHHPVPVGDADHEAHVAHPALRLGLLDVGPADALLSSGVRRTVRLRVPLVQQLIVRLQEVLYGRGTSRGLADAVQPSWICFKGEKMKCIRIVVETTKNCSVYFQEKKRKLFS